MYPHAADGTPPLRRRRSFRMPTVRVTSTPGNLVVPIIFSSAALALPLCTVSTAPTPVLVLVVLVALIGLIVMDFLTVSVICL